LLQLPWPRTNTLTLEPVSNFGASSSYDAGIKLVSNHNRRQVISEDQTAGGLEWGYALPGEPTGSNDEYIGYLVSIAIVCA
jgi:hypothetical protein